MYFLRIKNIIFFKANSTTNPNPSVAPQSPISPSKAMLEVSPVVPDEKPSSNRSTNPINESSKVSQESTPTALIPLMSVFNGPFTETPQVNEDLDNQVTKNDDNGDECDCEEGHDSDMSVCTKHIQNYKVTGVKNSRYLSYRNSLTNSVRGSLMEFSVPEDREEDVAGDGTSVYDEDEVNRRYSQRKRRRYNRVLNTNHNIKNQISTPVNSTVNPTDTIKTKTTHGNNNASPSANLGVMLHSCLMNVRRFVSTIDASSFINAPINLESIENNLKNKLIIENNSVYRRNNNKINLSYEDKNGFVVFLYYFAYIMNYQLFTNKILFILNFSFFLNIIGKKN